ncbi:MAG: helix-turn-helix domain-containing protein [Candidatus Aenigmatarchaeota archaeon]
MKKDLMDILRGFGLNLYERKIWLSLLSVGIASAGTLSSLSGVPRSRSYDILESLARKGLVLIQPGRPVKFIAVEPEEGLERLKKTILDRANEMVEKIESFKNSEYMKQLKDIYKNATKRVEVEELTGTLQGRGNIISHVIKMIKDAKKSLTLIATEDYLEDLNSLSSYLLDAKRRGVDVKIAAIVSERAREKLSALGNTANIIALTDYNFKGSCFMIDDKEVLLPITDRNIDESQQLAIWTKSDYAIEKLFKPLTESIFKSK